jgi:Leucine-rich repeat (LRR) protein
MKRHASEAVGFAQQPQKVLRSGSCQDVGKYDENTQTGKRRGPLSEKKKSAADHITRTLMQQLVNIVGTDFEAEEENSPSTLDTPEAGGLKTHKDRNQTARSSKPFEPNDSIHMTMSSGGIIRTWPHTSHDEYFNGMDRRKQTSQAAIQHDLPEDLKNLQHRIISTMGFPTPTDVMKAWFRAFTDLDQHDIRNVGALRALYLSDNRLTSLPPQLGTLTQLDSIYASHNRLQAIPKAI